jgi:PBP1b-binding outer membrane lipoprotein LpoB
MKSFLLFVLFIVVSSCTPSKKESIEKEMSVIDREHAGSDYGELLGTYDFLVRALPADEKDYAKGLIPWISLENTDTEIERLVNKETIIIPFSTITILIDYPLNNPAEFEITSKANGFNREELAMAVSKKYHKIYAEEDNSASQQTIPIEKREGLINRNETNGKYEIWGHDLSDLDMSSVQVYKDVKGKITVVLMIES